MEAALELALQLQLLLLQRSWAPTLRLWSLGSWCTLAGPSCAQSREWSQSGLQSWRLHACSSAPLLLLLAWLRQLEREREERGERGRGRGGGGSAGDWHQRLRSPLPLFSQHAHIHSVSHSPALQRKLSLFQSTFSKALCSSVWPPLAPPSRTLSHSHTVARTLTLCLSLPPSFPALPLSAVAQRSCVGSCLQASPEASPWRCCCPAQLQAERHAEQSALGRQGGRRACCLLPPSCWP